MLPYEFYFDSILDRLKRAAQWRQTVALRHPGDTRNVTAASKLSRFAKGRFSDVSSDVWERLSPAMQEDFFSDAIDVAVRNVGFRSHPDGIDAFVASIADVAKGFALPVGGAQ